MTTTSAICAIQALRKIFATHGIPEIVVSDNGTAFDSSEFRQFCDTNGIRAVYVAPYHPRSNGQAGIMVKATKDFLKKESSGDIHHRLAKFLHHHHATPSTATNKSPAELLFNRRIRTYFDHLHPDNIRIHKTKPVVNEPRILSKGSTVWARNYSSGPNWIPAVVTSSTGPVSYTVSDENSQTIRRHIDQLRCRDTEPLNTDVTTNGENNAELNIPTEEIQEENIPSTSSGGSSSQQVNPTITSSGGGPVPSCILQPNIDSPPSLPTNNNQPPEDIPLRRSARNKTTSSNGVI